MNFPIYGILIGLAFWLSFTLAEKILLSHRSGKMAQRDIDWLILLVFASGVAGARLYHVWTDWPLYAPRPWEALFIWRGGLGIYGAVAGGLAGLWAGSRLFRLPWRWPELLDAAFIALPFGQALGRFGNFFNQELYGRPTSLPWGIFIDPAHRLPSYLDVERYHPLFLYESLATLLMGLALFFFWRFNRRLKIPFLKLGSGLCTGLYLIGYGTIRFSLELLRIESAAGALGLSIAQWVSLGAVALGLGLLARAQRQSLAAILMTAALGATLLFFPAGARALTTPFDLSLSPSVVEIAVRPGKLVTQAFLVENGGTIDLEVTPILRDFTADDRSGNPVLLDQNTFPYAKLQNSDRQLNQPFTLPANSSQQLVLGLDIPEDAARRDWYFVLLLNTRPAAEGQLTGSGAQARGAIAANVLVRVTSDNLEPLAWKINLRLPRFLDSLQTLVVQAFVQNTGQTLAAPDMSVVVLDWRNNIVQEQAGLPDRILSGASREIFAARMRGDDPRSSTAAPFAYDPLFAFGPYRVRATIRNADVGPVVVEERVTAFPFSLLVAGLFTGAAWRFLRRRSRLTPALRQETKQK